MSEKEHNIDSQALHLLQQTAQYFSEHPQQQAYLVGGSLRNILLGEECVDWDIVTTGDAHRLAQQLADRLGGSYVRMHEKASRVVVTVEKPASSTTTTKKEICFDVSPLHGKTIEDDLLHRDFTINALATPLSELVKYPESDETGQPGTNQPQIGHPQGSPLSNTNHPHRIIVGATLVVALRTIALRVITHLAAALRKVAQHASTLGAGGVESNRLHLIDPLDALTDLQSRRLKAINENVFQNDPLRMLRAIRLMMRYQLQIDPWTESLLVRDAALLPQVAPERVHDELYAILGPGGATGRLRFLDEHGLFTVIFPEFAPARGMRQPSPHYWDVLEHSIESVGALERVAKLLQKGLEETNTNTDHEGDLAEIRVLLQEAQKQGIFSFAGLTAPHMKMAALLHDIGKTVTFSSNEKGEIHFYNHPHAGVPLVEHRMKRLCASTQDRRLAQLVAAHHMRPGQLGQDGPVTPRAIRRYFVDLGPTGIYIALFSLADHLATFGPQPTNESWQRHLGVVRLLLTRYIRERESILPPRLVSPEELMRRLKLEPGPIVGQLLDLIAEAQAEGTIHSKEEAIWFAEEHLPKRSCNPHL